MTIKKTLDKLSDDPAKPKAENAYSDYFKATSPVVSETKAMYVAYAYTSPSAYLVRKAEPLTTNTAWKNAWVRRGSNIQRFVPTLEKIKKSFVVANSVKVGFFLAKYPRLVDFLLEAAEQIGRYFPDDELHLEIASDPELGGHEELFAYVRTTLPVGEALEKLDEFDEAWFLDQSEATDGIFNFNLRFV